MKYYKIALLISVVMTVLGLCSADELAIYDRNQTYRLQDSLYVSGEVREVRTGENLVDLKTPEGLELTVPLAALPTFENNEGGYQKLEPGLLVKARAAEGTLGLEPGENGMFWVTVDGKKFVSLLPNDIHEDVFDDDEQTVTLSDGREVEIGMEEYMRRGILELKL